MKIIKRGIILLIIFMLLFTATSYATTYSLVTVTTGETANLENNQGYISKKITNVNSSTGEVTVQLNVSNTPTTASNTTEAEIFFVIDNSPSMDYVTSTGETRKDLILDAAAELVSSLFSRSSNIEVGLIDFHGNLWYTGANMTDATLRQALSSDEDTVIAAIEAEKNISTESGTDIEAGLLLAEQNFSSAVNNKIIILLTDGLPNADTRGNTAGDDCTSATSVLIAANTKETIENLKDDGIYTIALLTGIDDLDTSVNTEAEQRAAIESIFGTTSNPTSDKFYLVSDDDVAEAITNNIFYDVVNIIRVSMKDVKVVDYFPSYILEYFNFEYVSNPNIGTVSSEIDTQTYLIEWNIGTLKGFETATLEYVLTLKDMEDDELLAAEISLSEKTVLTYTSISDVDYTATLSTNPSVTLTEASNSEGDDNTNLVANAYEINNIEKDNTTATTSIPQTGANYIVLGFITLTVIIGVCTYLKNKSYKDI